MPSLATNCASVFVIEQIVFGISRFLLAACLSFFLDVVRYAKNNQQTAQESNEIS